MLANRTAAQPSSFTIPIVDAAGVKIEATSASWELFDERGNSLDAGAVADFDPAKDYVTFEIAGDKLSLPGATPSAGREIVVALATSDGEIEVRDYFLIVASRPLALMENSFVTYAESLGVRQGFGPILNGWDATLDVTSRGQALAEAFERLLRMSYKVPFLDWQSRVPSDYAVFGDGTDLPWDYTRRVRLRGMSVADFDQLPPDFVKAIKRAQLLEADIILGGDVVGRKRQDGIISETIGESSTYFSSKPYLNLPVSRQAYEEIKRYVTLKIGVARA